MGRYLQARTAFVDRAVVGAVDGGMPQAVLVGAGYDGRALRYARDGVSWFEVDHPDTQKDKRARLDRLGLACTHVSFIPIDLGHEDVAAAPCSLTAASNRSRHERASSLRVTSGSSTTSVLPTAARSPSLASSPVRASGGKCGAMPSQTNLLQIGSAMRNQSSAPPPWSSGSTIARTVRIRSGACLKCQRLPDAGAPSGGLARSGRATQFAGLEARDVHISVLVVLGLLLAHGNLDSGRHPRVQTDGRRCLHIQRGASRRQVCYGRISADIGYCITIRARGGALLYNSSFSDAAFTPSARRHLRSLPSPAQVIAHDELAGDWMAINVVLMEGTSSPILPATLPSAQTLVENLDAKPPFRRARLSYAPALADVTRQSVVYVVGQGSSATKLELATRGSDGRLYALHAKAGNLGSKFGLA